MDRWIVWNTFIDTDIDEPLSFLQTCIGYGIGKQMHVFRPIYNWIDTFTLFVWLQLGIRGAMEFPELAGTSKGKIVEVNWGFSSKPCLTTGGYGFWCFRWCCTRQGASIWSYECNNFKQGQWYQHISTVPCHRWKLYCMLVELFPSNLHRNHMKHRTISKAMCPITGEIL